MLKGRGGALTREKIVAHAAKRRVYLIQREKLVSRLGERTPLPVEVMRFGLAATRRALCELGLTPALRLRDGAEYETDNGHPVLDSPLPTDLDLEQLAVQLAAIPGVIGHGLFLGEADAVLIEDAQGAVTRWERAQSRA
jgi:ribose 5-phosphate isomerase A